MRKDDHMKTSRIMAAALLIVGSGLTLHAAKAQQAGIQRTDLLQNDLGIGDDAREPTYIKTVRSEGYVFSKPVEILEPR
jgi:hypothetical protein